MPRKTKPAETYTPKQLAEFWRLMRGGVALAGTNSEELASMLEMSAGSVKNLSTPYYAPTPERAVQIVEALRGLGIDVDVAEKTLKVLKTVRPYKAKHPRPPKPGQKAGAGRNSRSADS